MSTLINNFFVLLASHPWVITALIATVQIYFFINNTRKANCLRTFFKGQDTLKVDDDQIIYEESELSHSLLDLVNNLNYYFSKSGGAASVNVIQNKVENSLSNLSDDASARVSFPTFIGLMGTFLGSLCGLLAFNQGLLPTIGVTNTHVSQLIQGVVIAMTTSLLGLLLTTISNHKIAVATKEVNKDKNDFFDFIQVELIPSQNVDIVTAVNQLDRSIVKLLPGFQEQIVNFQETFTRSSREFGNVFTDGIIEISSAVSDLGSNVDAIGNSIRLQENLINTLKSPEISRTLTNFIAAANTFTEISSTISELEQYKDQIIQQNDVFASKQQDFFRSLSVPQQILDRLVSILDRISVFEENINKVGESIGRVEYLGDRELTLIEEHISAISRKNDLAKQYHQTANDDLQAFYRDQIEQLRILTNHFAETLNEYNTQFDGMMDTVIEELSNKRERFLAVLTEAFNAEELQQDLLHLKTLGMINQHVEAIENSTKTNTQLLSNIQSSWKQKIERTSSGHHNMDVKEKTNGGGKKTRMGVLGYLRKLFRKK